MGLTLGSVVGMLNRICGRIRYSMHRLHLIDHIRTYEPFYIAISLFKHMAVQTNLLSSIVFDE